MTGRAKVIPSVVQSSGKLFKRESVKSYALVVGNYEVYICILVEKSRTPDSPKCRDAKD